MSNDVVLIGLDGLCWDILEPALQDGRLPTLAGLRTDGTAGDLESTHPPWTPCAWPSLQSGRNPGAHGVFDFFARDGYEKELVDRRDIDAPYLPDVAAEHGRSAVSINFPVTHPVPEYENGAVVPGYLAPEDAEFQPPEIREAFEREYGEYTIYPEYGADEDAVEQYIDVARCRRDMARLLDGRYDWDLLAVQFQVTDSVFHDLDDPEERFDVLAAVDGFVDDIVSLADDPETFVVSDHGMGSYQWTFYVNSWLADNGYCETKTGSADYFRSEKEKLVDGDEETSAVATALDAGMTVGSAVGLTPQRVHTLLDSVGLAGYVERLLPADALLAAQSRTVDWERSDAFQLLFNSLGLHVNTGDGEYEALRDELIAELEAVTDPDGNRVFDAVERAEDVYDGAHVDDGPDLLLYPRDYQYDVSGSILGPFRQFEHQNHKPDGLFVASGPSLADTTVQEASLYDIAPTVAAVLGLPVDSARDGRVLPIVDGEVSEKQWETTVAVTDDGSADDADVEQRLSNLGYME